jgi:hypothetical protein
MLKKCQSILTGHIELAHVIDVEQTGTVADGVMLIENAAVLHRHIPAAKLDHPCAERNVRVVKWSLF